MKMPFMKTIYKQKRPFGCSVMLANMKSLLQKEIYVIEPSGAFNRYKAICLFLTGITISYIWF